MKFKFKVQSFQTEASNSVVNVFSGQSKQDAMRYRRDIGRRKGQATIEEMDREFETGFRNADIELSNDQLLRNIQQIQSKNNIALSNKLENGLGTVSLDVEMETGTGKTYVYIKTMFELYKAYGWSKYIVVVPSIAIREGVKKSFEMTQDHFMELYGIKARFFIYNSSNLHQLDEFSQNSGINVMIINTQAFNTTMNEEKSLDGKGGNEAARIIYSKRDEFASRRPIDVIKANQPIIILDEPQKMGGVATQNALKKNFNPLFSMNFSATHKTSHNLVYVLDALDAFKKKLVKRIEVKGFDIKNLTGTNGFIYLSAIVIDRKKPPRAKVEIEVKRGSGIKRETLLLGVGDNLYEASNQLQEYQGIYITEVDPIRSNVSFSNNLVLETGEATGNVNEEDIRRIQIRETIISHFEKEEKLFEQGIKCLSLFFIDEVAKYRLYDEDGEELTGEYGQIFEQEYQSVLNEYLTLFSTEYQKYLRGIEPSGTHNGYFSIDKKGKVINSQVKRGSEFSDDITAYDLILKNKERLLSFEEPTRFIFSHSALREGWDNPNVFQICTLKHSDNTTAKRQEVGRGLRLCVNEFGERQDLEVCGETLVHGLNVLTVIASESYAKFVSDLQEDIRKDLYDRPVKASKEYFEGKTFVYGNDEVHTLSVDEANAIYNYLIRNEYVDDYGHITDKYRDDNQNGYFAPLKTELQPMGEKIHQLIQSIFDPTILDALVVNAHETKVKDNPINENWKDFVELWNQINKRYAYTVEFESKELIEKSVKVINQELKVRKMTYTVTTGEQVGVEFDARHTRTNTMSRSVGSSAKYDLIGKIALETNLTRRTVGIILSQIEHDKIMQFKENPEEFISIVSKIINDQKASVVIEHISYVPSAEEPFTQEIFHMSKSSEDYVRAYKARNAIQDFIFTDGSSEKSVERRFAEDLDNAEEVVVYAKLPKGPKGFFIPTPVGNYSPDWAITFKKDSVKHIFFIAETKGSMDSLQLRPVEQAKITCAKKLFNELSTSEVKYHDVDSYQSLLGIIDEL